MWWVRFKAYAKVSGFDKALKTTIEPDMPASQADEESLDKTNTEDKKKLKAVKRNNETMSNLTLAFTNNTLLNKIMNSQTAECPEGLAHLVVKEL